MKANVPDKITECVIRLLRKNGVLGQDHAGKKIVIEICGGSPAVVNVTNLEDDEELLQRIICQRMKTHRARMSNVVRWNSITISRIKEKNLRDMLMYRNLGRVTLAEFSEALREEEIECLWMIELASESTT